MLSPAPPEQRKEKGEDEKKSENQKGCAKQSELSYIAPKATLEQSARTSRLSNDLLRDSLQNIQLRDKEERKENERRVTDSVVW